MIYLKEIKNDVPEYAEAKRLIDILKYFEEIPKEMVPGNSLLKEFFPQEDVQMYYSCPPEEVSGRNLACTHHEMSGDGKKEFADAGQGSRTD